jgi:hypothetical protein
MRKCIIYNSNDLHESCELAANVRILMDVFCVQSALLIVRTVAPRLPTAAVSVALDGLVLTAQVSYHSVTVVEYI